jgi:hypothetical protein
MVDKLYVVHGMQRSGNHAIIHWLMAQEKLFFINNIYPIKHVLEGQIEIEENMDFQSWYERQLHQKYSGWRGWLKRPFKKRYPVLVSIEDHSLELRPFVQMPPRSFSLLIVRDPKNFFASRIRRAFKVEHPAYPREMNREMERIREYWKMHAREFLGETDFLERRVGIYYNLWFVNQEYRRSISRQLGIRFSDKGKEKVTAYGGGSSFDSRSFYGQSDRIKFLTRYELI